MTNIKDYNNDCSDIAAPRINKFKTKRDVDPLNPIYMVESKSRRHIVQLGKIEGNETKINKSPKTRRKINDVSDI